MAIRLPGREADLLNYARTFSAVLAASPETYGCSPLQSANLASCVASFGAAMKAAHDPATRTRGNVAAKNSAKVAIKSNLRLLARIAPTAPDMTDTKLIAIGLSPRAAPTRIGAPTEPPTLTVRMTMGRTLKVRLTPKGSARRAKPDGVAGAAMFSFVGDAPPASLADFTFHGNTTRTSVDVSFPATTPAGSQVFLCAYWYSPRGKGGPTCDPVSAYIGGGISVSAMAA